MFPCPPSLQSTLLIWCPWRSISLSKTIYLLCELSETCHIHRSITGLFLSTWGLESFTLLLLKPSEQQNFTYKVLKLWHSQFSQTSSSLVSHMQPIPGIGNMVVRMKLTLGLPLDMVFQTYQKAIKRKVYPTSGKPEEVLAVQGCLWLLSYVRKEFHTVPGSAEAISDCPRASMYRSWTASIVDHQ